VRPDEDVLEWLSEADETICTGREVMPHLAFA
jgi:hypothetical protein